MDEGSLLKLKETIKEQYAGDTKQLEVIFSEADRVIVEAPAGYGKTTTMVSRIAYLLAKNEIPNPKRILALTFSVNATLKIKRDIAEKLPKLMKEENNPVTVSEKIVATNYHGFCKLVLSKHGFLIDTNLRRNINSFKAVGDEKLDKIEDVALKAGEIETCKRIENIIKSGNLPTEVEVNLYLDIVKNKLLPHNYITHNSELFFTLWLFDKYRQVNAFYKSFFTLIIVDEFQDTNIVAWEIIKRLIGDNTKLLFLGDPLQRIYGFIGALPNIMETVLNDYRMDKIVLSKNYRFKDNLEMLKLDQNIRLNAQSVMRGTGITETAELLGYWGENQIEESSQLADAVSKIINSHPDMKIAILCRLRGDNSTAIEEALLLKNIDYFYGMFTDDNSDYVNFHGVCYENFIKKFGKKQFVNNVQLKKFVDEIKDRYSESNNKSINSLVELLEALREKVSSDYALLSPEDKFTLVLDIFENRQLKQTMEYIKCNVILATIHGAKGLEWDYVFLSDLEQWVFPGYRTCICCEGKNSSERCKCTFSYTNAIEKQILEEISVFYVGVTRARKQVFVSASGKRANGKLGKFSCFSSMPGVKLIKSTV